MTAKQKKIPYAALVRHDGISLYPELPEVEQKALTAALDRLRFELRYKNAGPPCPASWVKLQGGSEGLSWRF